MLLLTRSRVEAFAKDSVAALIVKESPEASPMVVLPFILAVPSTSSLKAGLVVPIPTLPLAPEIYKVPAPAFKLPARVRVELVEKSISEVVTVILLPTLTEVFTKTLSGLLA